MFPFMAGNEVNNFFEYSFFKCWIVHKKAQGTQASFFA